MKQKFLIIALGFYIGLVFIPGMLFLYLPKDFPIPFPRLSQMEMGARNTIEIDANSDKFKQDTKLENTTEEETNMEEEIEVMQMGEDANQEQAKETEDTSSSIFGGLRDTEEELEGSNDEDLAEQEADIQSE